jgi:hypothetical protein
MISKHIESGVTQTTHTVTSPKYAACTSNVTHTSQIRQFIKLRSKHNQPKTIQMYHPCLLLFLHTEGSKCNIPCCARLANVARTCRARSAQQGMLLLNPSICVYFCVPRGPIYPTNLSHLIVLYCLTSDVIIHVENVGLRICHVY